MGSVIDRVWLTGLRIADPIGSKRTSLRVLAAVFLIVAVVLILGRLWILVPYDPKKLPTELILTQNVVDNLISACIAAFFGSIFLSILADSNYELEDISSIPAHQIHSSLLEPLSTTVNYWFRGRSGRFFRHRVLPALVDAAGRNASRRYVHLLLPDPDKQAVLENYADYRNSLRFEQGRWTARRVQVEVVATILAAAEQSAQNQFFVPRIAVGQDFALLRIDMSDERMVMTREHPSWPGIICTHRSKFYSTYKEEILLGMKQGRELDLSKFPRNTTINETNLASLISAFGFAIPDDDGFAREVIEAIRHPRDPYG